MKAIIMAGGFGTRLRPLTNKTPKPMVNIINKPLLEYIVYQLKQNGFTDIALTLGYLPEVVMNHFKDGKQFGVNITYFIEKTPLGTAGGVKAASSFIDDDFLVISGDSFCDINLNEFVKLHKQNGKLGSMVLKEMEDITGFGVVEIDNNNTITKFLEKPQVAHSKLINTGIYAFKKEVLRLIPQGMYDFGRDLFPNLLGELYGFITNDYWNDIGNLKAYYSTNLHVVNNKDKFSFFFED